MKKPKLSSTINISIDFQLTFWITCNRVSNPISSIIWKIPVPNSHQSKTNILPQEFGLWDTALFDSCSEIPNRFQISPTRVKKKKIEKEREKKMKYKISAKFNISLTFRKWTSSKSLRSHNAASPAGGDKKF